MSGGRRAGDEGIRCKYLERRGVGLEGSMILGTWEWCSSECVSFDGCALSICVCW